MSNAPEQDGERRLDPKLLEILVCPLTKTSLDYDAERQELISRAAGLAYPIRDGIPIMLPDEARRSRQQTSTGLATMLSKSCTSVMRGGILDRLASRLLATRHVPVAPAASRPGSASAAARGRPSQARDRAARAAARCRWRTAGSARPSPWPRRRCRSAPALVAFEHRRGPDIETEPGDSTIVSASAATSRMPILRPWPAQRMHRVRGVSVSASRSATKPRAIWKSSGKDCTGPASAISPSRVAEPLGKLGEEAGFVAVEDCPPRGPSPRSTRSRTGRP